MSFHRFSTKCNHNFPKSLFENAEISHPPFTIQSEKMATSRYVLFFLLALVVAPTFAMEEENASEVLPDSAALERLIFPEDGSRSEFFLLHFNFVSFSVFSFFLSFFPLFDNCG